MPTTEINDVSIYYEITGDGYPLILCHEFGGSYESWEGQVRCFGRRFKVITYSQRGFPPSTVPDNVSAYSQAASVEDLDQLLRQLGIDQAYICGSSMGGNVVLSFAIAHPERCRAVVLTGMGAGSINHAQQLVQFEESAQRLDREGIEPHARDYAGARAQLKRKDPRGWEEFYQLLRRHSAVGRACTLRGVQSTRPTIYQLEEQLSRLTMPTMILVGDEDEACIDPSLFMRRHMPNCGLVMFPRSGHTLNLEEPALFNEMVLRFLSQVEHGDWPSAVGALPAGASGPA